MTDTKKNKGEFIFHKEAPQFKIPEIKLKYISEGTLFSTDKISSAKDAEQILRLIYDKDEIDLQEQSVVLYLNRANKVIGYYRHSKGGVSQTVMDTRLILAAAIKGLASGIILCHNHPSGSLLPSEADISITASISRAAKDMDIRLLDHIILTSDGYYSFEVQGMLDGLPVPCREDRQRVKQLIAELEPKLKRLKFGR
jgi:DNA repair protein RadC